MCNNIYILLFLLNTVRHFSSHIYYESIEKIDYYNYCQLQCYPEKRILSDDN